MTAYQLTHILDLCRPGGAIDFVLIEPTLIRVPEPPRDPAPDASLAERAAWHVRARKWAWIDKRPVVRRERETLRRNKELSDRIYAELRRDTDFWRRV